MSRPDQNEFVVAVDHHQRGVERGREARIVELGRRDTPRSRRERSSSRPPHSVAPAKMRKPAHPWSHLTVHIRVLTVSGLGIDRVWRSCRRISLALASFNDCRFCDQCDGPIYVAFRGRIERSTSTRASRPLETNCISSWLARPSKSPWKNPRVRNRLRVGGAELCLTSDGSKNKVHWAAGFAWRSSPLFTDIYSTDIRRLLQIEAKSSKYLARHTG